jgi:capsular polysaccharide transport system ATP-binding protein
MLSSPRVKLIHLVSVAKSFPGAGEYPNVVLHPTTLSMPADRRVAVLAERREGKTALLRLLAGIDAPDQGDVIAPMRLSPVVNSSSFLHPQLTGVDNIRFFARMFCIDGDRLTAAIDSFCGGSGLLTQPVRRQGVEYRRALEIALASLLPFDCCLVDDFGQYAEDIGGRCLEWATQRRAGVIFTTNRPRLASQFADCAVVLRHGTLYPFVKVEEATRFYER